MRRVLIFVLLSGLFVAGAGALAAGSGYPIRAFVLFGSGATVALVAAFGLTKVDGLLEERKKARRSGP